MSVSGQLLNRSVEGSAFGFSLPSLVSSSSQCSARKTRLEGSALTAVLAENACPPAGFTDNRF